MSVDKFESSGSRVLKTDNRYVDRQFITLTKDLVTKLTKNGDTMGGPQNMQANILVNAMFLLMKTIWLIRNTKILSLQ